MAWGGADEQAAERAMGIVDAKNWQDEALKIVEHAMECYWNDRPDNPSRTATPLSVADSDKSDDESNDLESEYDRHRKALIAQTLSNSCSGWEAEI
jgi:hypothetical protein